MLARPTLALVMALLLHLAAIRTAVAINENTTLILHGAQASEWFLPCDHPALQGVDCGATLPQTDLSGFTRPAIFLLIRNYESIIGIQCAFDVPASWTLFYSDWLCLGGLYPDVNPHPPWGPLDGSLSYGIDPISGGALVTVGRMYFSSASAGCMTIIDCGYPGGTSVLSPNYTWTPILRENRGRLCNGPGGYDACNPISASSSTTWGAIKASYQVPRQVR